MAFTTSDSFQYIGIWLYGFSSGAVDCKGQETRMVIIFIILLGRGETPNA